MEQINYKKQDIRNPRYLEAIEYWGNLNCREKNEIMKKVHILHNILNKSYKDAYSEIIKYIMVEVL